MTDKRVLTNKDLFVREILKMPIEEVAKLNCVSRTTCRGCPGERVPITLQQHCQRYLAAWLNQEAE